MVKPTEAGREIEWFFFFSSLSTYFHVGLGKMSNEIYTLVVLEFYFSLDFASKQDQKKKVSKDISSKRDWFCGWCCVNEPSDKWGTPQQCKCDVEPWDIKEWLKRFRVEGWSWRQVNVSVGSWSFHRWCQNGTKTAKEDSMRERIACRWEATDNIQSQRPNKLSPPQELSVSFHHLECTLQMQKPSTSWPKINFLPGGPLSLHLLNWDFLMFPERYTYFQPRIVSLSGDTSSM